MTRFPTSLRTIRGGGYVKPWVSYTKENKRVDYNKQPLLPNEYQQVEYLESTGTQYINTGIQPDTNMRFEFRGCYTQFRKDNTFFGVDDSGTFGAKCFMVGNTYGLNGVACLQQGTIRNFQYPDFNVFSDVVFRNGIFSIDGTSIPFNETAYYKTTNSLYLFAWDRIGTPVVYSQAKIAQFKIDDENDTALMHLIPCYRKSDNKPGMWDRVSWQFFTNAGSGSDFTIGPDVYDVL